MSFKPISLKSGKRIASISQARDLIDREIGNTRRSEPLWASAFAEINSAMADPTREATARTALYKALVADELV
jgi:hypothetical protein